MHIRTMQLLKVFLGLALVLTIYISSITPAENQQGYDVERGMAKIKASSEKITPDASYRAEYVRDYKSGTSWCEGKDGDGIGESITFIFNNTSTSRMGVLKSFTILNGYTDKVYFNNYNRIRELEINDQTVTLKDTREPQTITLDKPIVANEFVFTIKSVYKGSKQEDTCITELLLNGSSFHFTLDHLPLYDSSRISAPGNDLLSAVYNNNLGAVKQAIANGAPPDYYNYMADEYSGLSKYKKDAITPLLIALHNKNLAIAYYLLSEAGASPDLCLNSNLGSDHPDRFQKKKAPNRGCPFDEYNFYDNLDNELVIKILQIFIKTHAVDMEQVISSKCSSVVEPEFMGAPEEEVAAAKSRFNKLLEISGFTEKQGAEICEKAMEGF